MALTLEPVTPEDNDFLLDLYADTRADELAAVPWSEEQKRAFLRQQFEAQDRDYRGRHPRASFLVVKCDGRRAGRLTVSRLDSEVRIVDIVLAPGFRGRGIGTALLGDVITTASEHGLPVTLHVERWNPARRLYERLGFREVARSVVHVLLEHPAPSPVS